MGRVIRRPASRQGPGPTAAGVARLAAITLGVLTPHAAAGPHTEIPEMTSGRAKAVLRRIPPPAPARTPPSTAPQIRALTISCAVAAAADFDRSLDAIAHASTSTGYALGHQAEASLAGCLEQECGVPVVTSCAAAVQALRTYQITRVALVHPPWFDDELNGLGSAYFRAQGFDAVAAKATGVAQDPARARPEQVIEWVRRHLDRACEAVFIGGNGLRAARTVEELERRTGKLVLQSNQVLLWSVLRRIETTFDITGYGRIFDSATATAG